MDPDLEALVRVLRAHSKAARRQLSTLARLLAEFDDRIAGLATDGQPLKEAHRNADRAEQDE